LSIQATAEGVETNNSWRQSKPKGTKTQGFLIPVRSLPAKIEAIFLAHR
jgi:hypothetical protein